VKDFLHHAMNYGRSGEPCRMAKVDQLMALVDELETRIGALCSTAGSLLKAVGAWLTMGSRFEGIATLAA
jgi:hypothetical protein